MPRKVLKRENRTGSIYKRSDYKRKQWYALAPAVVDANGKSHRQVIGRFETAREAKLALDKYNESPTDKLNITFEQAYAEWSEIAFRSVSKQTITCYNAAFKNAYSLHKRKLKDIRTVDMQRIIDVNENKSHSTLNNLKIIMRKVFEYGMKNDVVNKNYADFVVLPKASKKEKDCFTDIELQKLWECSKTNDLAQLVVIMCYTGFRINEFLSLTVFSYDKEECTLTGGSKTTAGKNRVVPVCDKIAPLVKTWYEKQGETLFCRTDGCKYNDNRFREEYYALLTDLGIRRLPPHATRHTFATLLSKAGARPEDMQKILGHANYAVTADVYIHQDISTLKEAVNLL